MTPAQWRYRAWGIDLAVPFPVPDLAEIDASRGVDLEIRVGVPPPGLDAVRFTLPSGARVALVDGRLAWVESRRDPLGLHPSLLRSILTVVLRQRGRVVLHAAAVELGGRTFALAGPAGSGKTTLAAALCAVGGRLITDEVCAVAVDGPGAIVLPGTRLLALRPDALSLVDSRSPSGSPGAPDSDERRPAWWRNGRVLREVATVAEPLPLDRLYLLEWGREAGVSLARTSRGRLVESLLRARFQPTVGPPGEPTEELAALGRFGRLCPAFRLRRASTGRPADVVEALRAGDVPSTGRARC